jgi:hypothetical protein
MEWSYKKIALQRLKNPIVLSQILGFSDDVATAATVDKLLGKFFYILYHFNIEKKSL